MNAIIEKSLKAISISNQNERKRITMSYSEITNQSLSQRDLMEAKERLRQQLTILAENQKRLLSCFNKQKELSQRSAKQQQQQQQQQQSVGSVDDSQSIHNQVTDDVSMCCTATSNVTNDDTEVLLTSSQPMVASTGSTDFAQPVGLDALINQRLLKPDKDCLSCTLMVGNIRQLLYL